MNYNEAIEYIHSVSNFFCKPGLDRIRELCQGLGNPQDGLKFIHITGTNGKGSVCSMTDSILRQAGYRVGLYTSPYVLKFNERMRVNGENIPDSTLARLTEKARTVAEKMSDKPTEFELITAIAFDYFKEEGCDVVVLEVGMGGLLDATNIIDSPLLSVITGVAIDHTAFLGSTVEQIAVEKAGIIKKHSPVLFGGDNANAETVITEKAREMQSQLYKTNYKSLKIKHFSIEYSLFNYKCRRGLKIKMLGSYQPKNAAIVLDMVDILNDRGLIVSEDAVRAGLENSRWPARFEIINNEPLVIFDGAHNPQGIDAAVNSIKEYFGGKKVIILTGVLRDKDYHAIANRISEVACKAYTITPTNPRALSAKEYAEVLSSKEVSAVACDSVGEAINLALNEAKAEGCTIICLGSLYLYAEVMAEINPAI